MADEEQTPDSIELITDQTQQTTDQTETINEVANYQTIAQILERFGIQKAALYERLKFLQIKPSKGKRAQSLFNKEQVELLDSLDEHIKRTGKMDGFAKVAQALSTEASQAQTQALVVTKDTSDTSIEAHQQNLVVQPVPTVISQADIRQIKSNAAERVKNLRLAEIEVARAMQENPNLLPAEIKQEIEEAEMAAISTPLSHKAYYDPKTLAQAVLASL